MAEKHDGGKAALALITWEFAEELARAHLWFGDGAASCDSFKALIGRAERHLWKFAGGEDVCRRSNLHHLAHVALICEGLLDSGSYNDNFPKTTNHVDDRLSKDALVEIAPWGRWLSASTDDEIDKSLTEISDRALKYLADVRAFGAEKYTLHGWKRGFSFLRTISAALRHLQAFKNNEDIDRESNLPHLAHVLANVEHIIYWQRRNVTGIDDRLEKPTKTSVRPPPRLTRSETRCQA